MLQTRCFIPTALSPSHCDDFEERSRTFPAGVSCGQLNPSTALPVSPAATHQSGATFQRAYGAPVSAAHTEVATPLPAGFTALTRQPDIPAAVKGSVLGHIRASLMKVETSFWTAKIPAD